MAPQPPVLLVDNVFDRVNLYTSAAVTATDEATGHEVRYLADYRRERTWWQAATDRTGPPESHLIASDLGVGASAAPNFWFVDRGHNLHGQEVEVLGSATVGSGFDTTSGLVTIPAAGVVGGDPTTGACATEEGACYGFFTANAARRVVTFAIRAVDDFIPVVPGLMVGVRTQLLGYSDVYDPDAGTRVQRTETSDAGWKATGRTTSYRRLTLALRAIGSTEYDSTVRYLRRTLFERDQPAFVVLDYGSYPERGWLYQLDAQTFDMPKTRATHAGALQLREVGVSY